MTETLAPAAATEPLSPGLWYRLASRMAPLAARLYLKRRAKAEPDYAHHIEERWGHIPHDPNRAGGVVVHAASVGEVRAARALVDTLVTRFGKHRVTLSVQTPTGRAAAQQAFGEALRVVYAPLDARACVDRWLDAIAPRALLLIEREIWPNWLHAAHQQAICIALINARMTADSARSHGAAYRGVWRALDVVAATDAADAQRLIDLGIDARRVRVVGNLKFDVPALDPGLSPWPDRSAIVAASTHEGEEAELLQAWQQRADRDADLLVIAPRHPQRFDAVAALVEAKGLRLQRWSSGSPIHAETQVVLVDSMGELARLQAHAVLVIQGGTFVPIGGHNAWEAVAQNVPSAFGAYTSHFESLYAEMAQCGAGRRVGSMAEALGVRLDARAACAALRERHAGALQRALEYVGPALDRALGRVEPALVTVWHGGQTHAWLDPGLCTTPPDWHGAQASERLATGSGRGQVALIDVQGPAGASRALLRHYRRGGWVARFNEDAFTRTPPHQSRAMREHALLRLLTAMDLPVPRPVASAQHVQGRKATADIAVSWIANSQNLVQWLKQRQLTQGEWANIGAAIRALHEAQVYHSDLNAHNLLLDDSGAVWLVDFDKCSFRGGHGWKADNLRRLRRSVEKEARLAGQRGEAWFADPDAALDALLAGYERSTAHADSVPM